MTCFREETFYFHYDVKKFFSSEIFIELGVVRELGELCGKLIKYFIETS